MKTYHANEGRENGEDSCSEQQGNDQRGAFRVPFECVVDFIPFTVAEGVCGGQRFIRVPGDYDLESRGIVSLGRTKGSDDQAGVEGCRVL